MGLIFDILLDQPLKCRNRNAKINIKMIKLPFQICSWSIISTSPYEYAFYAALRCKMSQNSGAGGDGFRHCDEKMLKTNRVLRQLVRKLRRVRGLCGQTVWSEFRNFLPL